MILHINSDFSSSREQMVVNQLRGRDITDEKVLIAMGQIPREKFVPQNYRDQAYQDCALPIGEGQTISQPYTVAFMTQLLKLKGGEKVLEIGTGSGYQAAVLAKIATAVYTIERCRELAKRAEKVFEKLNISNIRTKLSDGSRGWEEFSPYEAIIVTAAADKIPPALIEQLSNEGRLVIPVGPGNWSVMTRLTKRGEKLVEEKFGFFSFVPLITK